MIRTVDKSLEVLAHGLGQAILDRHPNQSVEAIIALCPNLKDYQRGLFDAPVADPSTMLAIAIDRSHVLGVNSTDLHSLRKFRNKLTHKEAGVRASVIALDIEKVHGELTRAVKILDQIGCKSETREVKRYLVYYLAGAPDPWKDPDAEALDELVAQAAPKKPPRKTSKPRQSVHTAKGELSPDQSEALRRVKAWFASESRRFVIAGPAGTGKTRLIPEMIRALNLLPEEVQLVAPTHKACEVLRSKLASGSNFKSRVSTFHSLLYQYARPAFDGEDLKFTMAGMKPVREGVKLVICDEASMLADVDVEVFERGYRTLYIGDAAQLPPILEGRDESGRQAKASTILLSPHAELSTIHRQAGGSSILDAADIVRAGKILEPTLWDDDATTVLDEAQGHVTRTGFRDLLKVSDAVLVARNVTRIRVNEMIRELRGFVRHPGDWIPKPGEFLVSSDKIGQGEPAFEGQPSMGNGQQLVVQDVVDVIRRLNKTTRQGVMVAVVRAHFRDDPSTSGVWPISHEMLVGRHVVGDVVSTRLIAGPRSGVLRCDWGYALTVHKAQGSEWRRVVVIDHGSYDRVSAREWNYVALTRARESVTVVRLKPDTELLS